MCDDRGPGGMWAGDGAECIRRGAVILLDGLRACEDAHPREDQGTR